MHLVITDSGLGGLSICAGLEQELSRGGPGAGARLTYVNAWPEEGRGYNDLPDLAARAAVFDRALRCVDDLRPDRIVIACNTLSIVYEHTAHRQNPGAPVHGIVEAGVELFAAALRRAPAGALVLVGTRTTIGSGVHRERLLALGIAPSRVSGASCHGLATAIERGPHSDGTAALIETCAGHAAAAAGPGTPLFIGLCCTHYGMVGERLRAAVQARRGGPVEALDPNERLVTEVVAALFRRGPGPGGGGPPADAVGAPVVRVLSKVRLGDEQRAAVAVVLERVSPATAAALRAYEHVPDLF